MDDQRHSFNTCPYCSRRLAVPPELRHCDFCHRTYAYSDGLVQNLANDHRYDGRMKGICDFCREKSS